MLRRLALSVIVLLVTAAPAAAHVTVQPPEAAAGGFAKLAFRTPNERDDAGTVKLEVTFPEEHPLFSVSVRPMEEWEATVERTELDEPVEVFGEPRTDAVTKITWEGDEIEPGQFEEFEISVGPLPEDAESLVFKALQTYDSGEVVRWIEEPTDDGEEPEHPAPVLRLVGDEAGDAAAVAVSDVSEDSDDTDPVAVAALLVGLAALAFSIAALVRRRPPERA